VREEFVRPPWLERTDRLLTGDRAAAAAGRLSPLQPPTTIRLDNGLDMSEGGTLDGEEFARWRQEADRALEGARVQAGAGLHNWACFAAEQAAQLAVKALLHGLGRGPWGYDLPGLGDRLREAGVDVPAETADAMRRLGRHYIPARYPDAHASGPPGTHYGASDSDEAIADAEGILAFVDSSWESLRG
jgi:HEPN domain-containing protein